MTEVADRPIDAPFAGLLTVVIPAFNEERRLPPVMAGPPAESRIPNPESLDFLRAVQFAEVAIEGAEGQVAGFPCPFEQQTVEKPD
jgi:hypothetical protein